MNIKIWILVAIVAGALLIGYFVGKQKKGCGCKDKAIESNPPADTKGEDKKGLDAEASKKK